MTLATVFVSRPAMLTAGQKAIYARWSDGLAALGFALVTIPRAEYAACPWAQLRRALGRADGAVILGFRQAVVEGGSRRPGTPEQESAAGSYASAWNQIEAGLAAMAELPVLAVPEGDAREGVFSADVWRDGVYGTQIDVWTAGDGAQDRSLRDWATAVRRRAESLRGRVSTADPVTEESTTVGAGERDDTYRRLEAAIRESGANARTVRRIHRCVHVLQRSTAAALPIVACVRRPNGMTAPLAALAAALGVAEDIARWHERWWFDRMTAEALQHERSLFLSRIGPYADALGRLAVLRERLEGLVSQEHARRVDDRAT